ncbi:hypothetical protein A3Q56_05455 [Intoshia linei]|uniref:Transcription initiation factor IIF subunit alpha n=1 Tax=Intoshia linei TaxID=1819745 RepID=A0A177AXX9_9BILA|nr:hypothetical protein A3Q56_05455 [Intoshia linei]
MLNKMNINHKIYLKKNSHTKSSIVKFNTKNVNLLNSEKIEIAYENNYEQWKKEYDFRQLDKEKTGAGTEFNANAKILLNAKRIINEEALKPYNKSNQPRLLNIQNNGIKKSYKGIKNNINYSYFVFMFDKKGNVSAVPIDDWYTFAPINRYKHFTEEEAEQHYQKKNSNLNKFSNKNDQETNMASLKLSDSGETINKESDNTEDKNVKGKIIVAKDDEAADEFDEGHELDYISTSDR